MLVGDRAHSRDPRDQGRHDQQGGERGHGLGRPLDVLFQQPNHHLPHGLAPPGSRGLHLGVETSREDDAQRLPLPTGSGLPVVEYVRHGTNVHASNRRVKPPDVEPFMLTEMIDECRVAAMTTVGQKLRARRKELGLSQLKLEVLAGVNRQTVGRIERGEDFNVSTLRKLAPHLRFTLSELIGDDKSTGEVDNVPPPPDTLALAVVHDIEHFMAPCYSSLRAWIEKTPCGAQALARADVPHERVSVLIVGAASLLWPTLLIGDKLVLDDEHRSPRSREVCVCRIGEDLALRRYRLEDGEGWFEVDGQPAGRIPAEGVEVLGVVMLKISPGKNI
jgi:DNA-binding XRE family transcriptional regulator